MTIRALIVKGPFTEDELLEVANVVRRIERHHPEYVYEVIWSDNEVSIAEATKQLLKVFPRLEGQDPDLVVVQRGGLNRAT